IRHYDKNKKILNININEQKDDKIIFEIADNGSGCNEEVLDKIFEPLYTTDKSRKISGLGLSICKEIVESHNGTIKAINNKLGGFSIIFTIDAYKED
ncbi:MAG: sensor histidine kinase, partial [Bacilli bacterium]|nr:sensor histidine kinase [Bacilli bacterium]